MFSTIHKLSAFLLIVIALAASPLCKAFAECQKLGEYCGNPPTETFPACCPFDINTMSGEQAPLRCQNLDNGVGTCETDEDSASEPESEPE